jgi:hypothetical protein
MTFILLRKQPRKIPPLPSGERIEVRGDTIWTFTPTLALPHRRGRGEMKSIFPARAGFEDDVSVMKHFVEVER